jgi:hypothetical protein
MLEWRQEGHKSALLAGVALAVIGATVPTANSGGVAWVTTWYWWVFFALCALVGYGVFIGTWIACGATWLQNGKRWVSIYELTEVRIKASGTNHMLRLTDSAGRTIGSLKLIAVQRNPKLWDLVYNGIQHSVATGKATPPSGTRKILRLPDNF